MFAWMAGLIGVICIITIGINRYPNQKVRTEENDQLSRLIGACFGDKGKAERLIEYEKKKMPWLDRDSAIQMAIDRLSKDRGIR